MDSPKSVVLGRPLSVHDIDVIARRQAVLTVDTDALTRLNRSYAFVQDLARAEAPVYGLTTGCGPLAGHRIPAAQRETFQRNLIRSHAVALGRPHATDVVRAAMAVRAQTFTHGCSGVDPATVEVLVQLLNTGRHPIVREVGGVGASGDLVELAELALVVTGEGTVEVDGVPTDTAAALHAAGITPLAPRFREGLALMNGTAFHTGAAAVLLAEAQRITRAAQVGAAMLFEALHANLEALDPALHAARPHPGQRAVGERLGRIVAGSSLVRRDGVAADSQDAYTLRCIPQVLGPVVDALQVAHDVIDTEINSVVDNPLFLVDQRRVVHGGNFHGQAVAMALDNVKIAMVELGVASERRIARVLDATLSRGLPAFLIAAGAGLRSGFMGLQYGASAMAADNAVLAAPTSVRSVPTNANNQDVVSMGMVAARHARQVVDNATRLVAIELLCAAQALDLRGAAKAGAGTRAAHDMIRAHVAPLVEDRPMRDDVDALAALIADGTLVAAVDRAVAE